MASTEHLAVRLDKQAAGWARAQAKARNASLSAPISATLLRAKRGLAWDAVRDELLNGTPLSAEEIASAEQARSSAQEACQLAGNAKAQGAKANFSGGEVNVFELMVQAQLHGLRPSFETSASEPQPLQTRSRFQAWC